MFIVKGGKVFCEFCCHFIAIVLVEKGISGAQVMPGRNHGRNGSGRNLPTMLQKTLIYLFLLCFQDWRKVVIVVQCVIYVGYWGRDFQGVLTNGPISHKGAKRTFFYLIPYILPDHIHYNYTVTSLSLKNHDWCYM